MAESTFIVRVPRAESCVGALRERYDASSRLGVPAHITVLFPFMSPERIDDAILRKIGMTLGQVPPFDFTLASVERFPATTYLAPEPAEPFVALTQILVREFPEFPPFGGEFPTVIPHLTVAHGCATEAALAEEELVTAMAEQGPIQATCGSVVLMENSTGLWREMHVFELRT
jgi:2'-5' RNA ligase